MNCGNCILFGENTIQKLHKDVNCVDGDLHQRLTNLMKFFMLPLHNL